MKKFFFKLSNFLIPVILIEISIFLLKDIVFKEKQLQNIFSTVGNKYYWINKINHNKKILLLGSSSVRYGLSCSILNQLSHDSLSFINLATDARDPIETYFILKQINLTGVKAAYFGLDPWIYTKRYYKYRNPYLYLDMSFLSSIKYSIEHDKTTFLKRYIAFFDFVFSTRGKSNDLIREIPTDYGSFKLKGKPKNFKESVDNWFETDRYGWSQLQFIYLQKIISFCKTKNIEFIPFLPPKRSDFTDIYKLKCKSIHKEFTDNLIKTNFTLNIFGKFNQLDKLGNYNLFVEAYHLNPLGQSVYSVIFYKMILPKKDVFNNQLLWSDMTYKKQ
ncbi:MAG: hypothetical protein HXX14_13040 [Bacteroidetes bacterium]|nr:hypothetical protein [Bacteroidota bacterium]